MRLSGIRCHVFGLVRQNSLTCRGRSVQQRSIARAEENGHFSVASSNLGAGGIQSAPNAEQRVTYQIQKFQQL
jgi:hypothetical protein